MTFVGGDKRGKTMRKISLVTKKTVNTLISIFIIIVVGGKLTP